MSFIKNTQLYPNVCKVSFKPTVNVDILNNFTDMYSTPSSIKWIQTATVTKSGVIYTHSVSFLYPGLKSVDFTDFDNLIRDRYILRAELFNGDVYDLNNEYFPFKLSYQFSEEKGFVLTFKGSVNKKTTYSHNIINDGFPYPITFTLA